MIKKFYDFGAGHHAIKRMFSIVLQKLLGKHRRLHKHQFFTDGIGYIDQQICADGVFERGLLGHIENVVERSGFKELYVDIGANIGNHVVGVSGIFDRAIAFEPHPALFHVLSANVISNGCNNVELFNYGLGSVTTSGTLIESPSNHGLSKVEGMSTMSAGFFDLKDQSFSKRYNIDICESASILEKYSENLGRAFIKIDVEGMEFDILSSLKPLIIKHNPIVAFEWVPSEQPELHDFVTSMTQYQFYGVYIAQSSNFILRHLKNLFLGRRYCFTQLDMNDLPDLLPLVFMIPKKFESKSWD